MKPFLSTALLSIFSILLFGQTDPAAKALLEKVSKKYEQYKTIQSDFTLVVRDAEGNSYNNAGKMLFDKPQNQYRIKLQNQDIISNGKSVWSISDELKEVQVTEAEDNSSSIGPNNLFSFYKTGYKYVSMPDEKITKNGKSETVNVVELSPLDTKTNYFKIKLRVNNNTHIHDVTIFDKSNNRYIYTINTLYVNHNIAKTNFEFQKEKYKDFEIVDLR